MTTVGTVDTSVITSLIRQYVQFFDLRKRCISQTQISIALMIFSRDAKICVLIRIPFHTTKLGCDMEQWLQGHLALHCTYQYPSWYIYVVARRGRCHCCLDCHATGNVIIISKCYAKTTLSQRRNCLCLQRKNDTMDKERICLPQTSIFCARRRLVAVNSYIYICGSQNCNI